MKYLTFLLLLLLPLSVLSDDAPEIESVKDLLWKNRIILIWSGNQEAIARSLNDSAYDIKDRDIFWFVLNGSKVVSNYPGKISENFAEDTASRYSSAGKRVILVGKDGEVKRVADTLTLDLLFETIDSMPMRINEMKEKEQMGD